MGLNNIRPPVKAELVTGFGDLKNPGQFIFTSRIGTTEHTGLLFLCPCGCGEFAGIGFDVPAAEGLNGPKWKWDGNDNAPTITPSIRRLGGCGWHGHLINGEFREY